MENSISDIFQGLQNLYLNLYSQEISEEYQEYIEPYINQKDITRIHIWKYFSNKIMTVIEKENKEVHPYLETVFKELFGIIEELKTVKNSNNEDIVEKFAKENQDLVFMNNELTIAVEQLESENKSYLEKIISSSKLTADTSISRLKSPTDRKEIIPRQPSKKTVYEISNCKFKRIDS